MVAKTFQTMTQLGEPYEVNGKSYVQVRNEKTGTVRQVRWYTPSEYRKLYPDSNTKAPVEEKKKDKYYRPLCDVLGFNKGYITIFSNADEENEYFIACAVARYSTRWGWYIPSEDEVPTDLPEGINKHILNYASVFNNPDTLKPDAEINRAIDSLIYEPSASQFVGTIGERIEIDVMVVNAVKLENQYGLSTLHVFEDTNQNQYVWATSAKSWAIGTAHHIRGTVKAHKSYRGVNQTILQRCLEI